MLGAVIQHLDVLLTNDTGPAHIAYALDAPVVTIWGSADLARYGPIATTRAVIASQPVPCRPCTYEVCPYDTSCIEQVTVSQVVESALRLMNG